MDGRGLTGCGCDQGVAQEVAGAGQLAGLCVVVFALIAMLTTLAARMSKQGLQISGSLVAYASVLLICAIASATAAIELRKSLPQASGFPVGPPPLPRNFNIVDDLPKDDL
jgi:hypothetical protein